MRKKLLLTLIAVFTCSLTAFALTACKHNHEYTSTVTNPTCTEQGYTTYTCECGSSYVSDYATGDIKHNFVDGYCTECGSEYFSQDLEYVFYFDNKVKT